MDEDFYTLKGYERKNTGLVTKSMEDYLEMICRHCGQSSYVRVNFLATQLHVHPSSASKMALQLKKRGLVEFERYGQIRPTELGRRMGEYLLHRHEVLHRFFCLLNRSDNEVEQVEQIEHFINAQTVENLDALIAHLQRYPF